MACQLQLAGRSSGELHHTARKRTATITLGREAWLEQARASSAPAALRPQLKMVRGGGSAPLGLTDWSGVTAKGSSWLAIGSAGAAARWMAAITMAGQPVAHAAVQEDLQQSLLS